MLAHDRILVHELHISAYASKKLDRIELDSAYRTLNSRKLQNELLRAVHAICQRHVSLRRIVLNVST